MFSTPTGILRGAAVWTAIGLISGLYYRELTKTQGFTGPTQLSVTHTHTLTLGTLVLLAVLALTLHLRLDADRRFRWAMPLWHVGLTLTAGAMLTRGTLQVLGSDLVDPEAASSKAIAGIAGLGHMTLTAALLMLFLALGARLRTTTAEPGTRDPQPALESA